MTAPVDLDALSALLAKGGRWNKQHDPRWTFANLIDGDTGVTVAHGIKPEHAARILAAHNALPALIAELRAAREDAERYRQVRDHDMTVSYADHIDSYLNIPDYPLSGFDAVIDAARREGQK